MRPCVAQTDLSRDKEKYLTIVETWSNWTTTEHTRGNSQTIVNYYINGTMIDRYGMDPENVVPKSAPAPEPARARTSARGWVPLTHAPPQ